MLRRLSACWLVAMVIAIAVLPAIAADAVFPFGSELMLDGNMTRGHKRLPTIAIEQDGSAAIDLWCGSVRAQATVAAPAPLRRLRSGATTGNAMPSASPATTICSIRSCT